LFFILLTPAPAPLLGGGGRGRKNIKRGLVLFSYVMFIAFPPYGGKGNKTLSINYNILFTYYPVLFFYKPIQGKKKLVN